MVAKRAIWWPVWVVHTRCWSYTLGVGQIHTVGVVYIHSCWSYTHAGFGLYTLGVGHTHSLLVVYTRCESYTLGGTKEPHAQLRRDFLYWSPCNLHALSLNFSVASITGKVICTLSKCSLKRK